jgi:hypothetical protein
MNSFTLKIIALLTMIIDHTGAVFPETFGFQFRVIGRVAFPLYVFLIAEGFRHTKSPGKFLARLFAFAIISEPFFDWALGSAYFPGGVNFLVDTNIFYTLFLGGASIVLYEYVRKKSHIVVALLPFLAFAWLAHILSSDYGAYGVVFIFVMYALPYKGFPFYKGFLLVSMALLCLWQHEWLFRYAFSYGFAQIPPLWWTLIPATLVPVFLVAFYNGKRGPSLKWFFYASYPTHLAVLVSILLISHGYIFS